MILIIFIVLVFFALLLLLVTSEVDTKESEAVATLRKECDDKLKKQKQDLTEKACNIHCDLCHFSTMPKKPGDASGCSLFGLDKDRCAELTHIKGEMKHA